MSSATIRPDTVVAKVHNPKRPLTAQRFGTAWCLTQQCDLLITNHHVIRYVGQNAVVNGEKINFWWDATGPDDEAARLIPSFTDVYKFNVVRDLALLQVKKPLSSKHMHPVSLFAGELTPGETVTIASYPGGKFTTATAHFDSFVEQGILRFDLDSPLAAGCSGGVILNTKDQAVGVVFALHPSKLSAYAVPIWSLADFIKKVRPDLYSSLFPVPPFRPAINGRLLFHADIASPEADTEAATTENQPFLSAAISGIDPAAVLSMAFLRRDLTPLPNSVSTAGVRDAVLQVRPTEPPEVQKLRRKAQLMVQQMSNFIALQTLTLGDNSVWQHQLRVIDGQQIFTRADGTELKELPIPRLGVVPGSEWRDLAQMVGTNLRLPLREAGERIEDGRKIKVFSYSATKEDEVCGMRVKRAFHRLWKSSAPCHGEVWTDSDLNILRITQETVLPPESSLMNATTVVLYGWLKYAGGSDLLVPTSIYLRAQTAKGHAIESSATFTAYRVFHAQATVVTN